MMKFNKQIKVLWFFTFLVISVNTLKGYPKPIENLIEETAKQLDILHSYNVAKKERAKYILPLGLTSKEFTPAVRGLQLRTDMSKPQE